MMKKVTFFLVLAVLLPGCYMTADIKSAGLNPSTVASFPKNTSVEVVSGGTKYETTALHGYKVRHSVGALFSKQAATTPQGYKVYSQIQGRISAGEDKQ